MKFQKCGSEYVAIENGFKASVFKTMDGKKWNLIVQVAATGKTVHEAIKRTLTEAKERAAEVVAKQSATVDRATRAAERRTGTNTAIYLVMQG